MKKPIAIFASVMLISLCACGTEEPTVMIEETETVTEAVLPETETETETEVETETESEIETEQETDIETESEADFEVEDFGPQTMYANTNVNIRSLPTQNSEKLGALALNDTVNMTGIVKAYQSVPCLWYRIDYGEGIAFVNGSYLSESKVERSTAAAPSTATPTQKPSAGTGACTGGAGTAAAPAATPAPAPAAPVTAVDAEIAAMDMGDVWVEGYDPMPGVDVQFN